jgi:hypothetical protein
MAVVMKPGHRNFDANFSLLAIDSGLSAKFFVVVGGNPPLHPLCIPLSLVNHVQPQ